MPRGGARRSAGRPAGAATRKTRELADKAAVSGMLPHEILLAIARGEVVGGHEPTFAERLDAAKSAAPYFAPRLAAVAMKDVGRRSLDQVPTDELLAMLDADGGNADSKKH